MQNSDFHLYLAAIVQSSDDAIISKDLNGIIRSFNPAAERLFGYSAAEIVGKSIEILIPPERRDEETRILATIRSGQRVDHFETVRLAKDGHRIDLSLTISPVRAPNGEIVGASKIARDVTERRRAAAALAEQQEWFRITLNSIGDAVIASDRDGCVTFLNHEAERLTGWSNPEAAGRPLNEVFNIVNEDSRKAVENPATRVMRLGRVVGLANHTILVGKDGSEWPIADSAAPIVTADGTVIGVVLVFREITELKRGRERERTAALERDRLLQDERAARSEAERANRVKDDFVAMVSHELRTPLNAILGWTDILQQRPADEATLRHGLEVIARNTRLQVQLISDLLDVSRIVSGKLHLEMEHVDVAEVIRNSVEGLQPAASDKGVAIGTRLETEIETIGDPARLQQVLWNLISNAIKFTPKGGSVNVALRKVDGHAEITVIDTGIGIRPEILTSVFERFRQGSPLTTRRHGGLGLGLSITKHIVELHGGSVRAYSAGDGQGATFTVELPLRTQGMSRSNALDRARVEADAAPVALRGIKVLVVEDDRDTRDLVRSLLEVHGATVVTAANAEEALARFADDRPDVIVSDIGLPDVDGYELIRRIRALGGANSNLPAVALTAFARSQDRTRALAAGFNAHVAKPVEPTELVMTVGSIAQLIPSKQNR